MKRLRGYDLRLSRLPSVLGLCAQDKPQIFGAVNSAQERLLMAKEAGDEGWWGTYAEILFRLSREAPYFTAPREVARLQLANVCNRVWQNNNQFSEYLRFGSGRLPKICRRACPIEGIFERNVVTVFSDPPTDTPYYIRIYGTNDNDYGGVTRVLIQGNDPQDATIYSQDGLNIVSGEFVTLASPFAQSTNLFKGAPTGIQKDMTYGAVQFFWVDPTTNAQTLMLTMEPGEQTASYRRYYFNSLPRNCTGSGTLVTATAIVKLDLIPISLDTDYCLIQSQEALINECEAIRYEGMDNLPAANLADRKHKKAVQYLNGQLAHFEGTQDPAVNFAPFGNAHFARETAGFI